MNEFEKALTEATAGAIKTMLADGKLAELVQTNVEKTIDSAVHDALRHYSDFGKSIDAAVKQAVQINTDDLGLAGYNKIILNIIRDKMNALVETEGRQRLVADMEKLLAGPAPKEITASEVVRQFLIWHIREAKFSDKQRTRPTVMVQPPQYSYSGWDICLDREANKSEYSCAYRLSVRENGDVIMWNIEGYDASKMVFSGRIFGFAKTLFHMYCCDTKVIVNSDEQGKALAMLDLAPSELDEDLEDEGDED